MQKRLFLIDGTALAYRSFFAFQGSGRAPLTTAAGHPTAATYGFCTTLRALLEREKPDAIAISFDGPRSDLQRTKVYPEYKSTRTKMPDEMAVQLDDIRQATEGFGIPIVVSETHEADDVIGTLAVQGRDAGMEVFVVTGDKDFLQLVDPHIKLWNLRSSTAKPEILDEAAAEAKWGVPPSRMVDLLALMGDSSDNIPGVPKIGEKTAVELLKQFGSLDEILARTTEVTKKSVRESLEQNRDKAILSRDLVRLRLDVPLPLTIADLPPAHPDPEKLRPLFQRLEFTNLLSALASHKAPEPEIERTYRTIDDDDAAVAALRGLGSGSSEHPLAIALECGGNYPRHLRLGGVAIAAAPGQAFYVPIPGPGPRFDALKDLLAAPTRQLVVHDAKRLLAALRHAELPCQAQWIDTMLASYCAEPGATSHSLEALALRHFAYKKTSAKDLVGTGKKQRTFAEVDAALVGDFVCEEADLTLRLWPRLRDALAEHGTAALHAELEQPLVPVLLDMEWEGIAIDRDHLAAVATEMKARIATLEKRVFERVGHEFALGSPQQLGKVLFEELEAHRAIPDGPKPKKTPTGQWKTDHDVLELLAPHHEVPALVLEWRQLTKLLSTYVESLPQLVDPTTKRVHSTFNQAVAATGRLSSEDPNLQNIPIRTDEGKKVRAAFVPRAKAWTLLSADYSQIELRILAHLSGDKALVESFRKGEDIHARTAAIVHGMMPALVTPELRNQAKVINYGLMYGMGASRLAKETGMRPPEAKKFIERYFQALPGVKRYLDESLATARDKKEARTMFGRRRPLGDIDSTNAMQRIAAENMAVNTPIQGAAADIVKRAMLAVHAELVRRGLRAKLLLQVHDELVLDVPQEELTEVRRLVIDAMQGAATLAVPLEVSVGDGPNWLAAH